MEIGWCVITLVALCLHSPELLHSLWGYCIRHLESSLSAALNLLACAWHQARCDAVTHSFSNELCRQVVPVTSVVCSSMQKWTVKLHSVAHSVCQPECKKGSAFGRRCDNTQSYYYPCPHKETNTPIDMTLSHSSESNLKKVHGLSQGQIWSVQGSIGVLSDSNPFKLLIVAN